MFKNQWTQDLFNKGRDSFDYPIEIVQFKEGLDSVEEHFGSACPSKEDIKNYCMERIEFWYNWASNCGDDQYEAELDRWDIECMRKVYFIL